MYHYYMFNKPFGCVCARRDDRYPTVMDYFSDLDNPDLSPVGRLDRATEGLLLVTDDGMFNQKLTHPSYKKEKTYLFTAMGTLSEEDLYALEHGVQLTGSDRLTAPAHVCVTATSVLKEVLPTLHPEIQSASCHNRPEHPIVFGEITVTEGSYHGKLHIRRNPRTGGVQRNIPGIIMHCEAGQELCLNHLHPPVREQKPS